MPPLLPLTLGQHMYTAYPAYMPMNIGYMPPPSVAYWSVSNSRKPMTVQATPARTPQLDPKLSGNVVKRSKPNPLQNGPLRYLGYVNEVSTAWWGVLAHRFSSMFASRVNTAANGIATLYSLADAFREGTEQHGLHKGSSPSVRRREVTVGSLGTLTFQMLASVLVPPKIVDALKHGTEWLIDNKSPALKTLLKPGSLKRTVAVASIATLSIPLIVKPVDATFHWVVKNVYWPIANTLYPKPQ